MGWLGDLLGAVGAGVGTIVAPGVGTAVGGALGGAAGNVIGDVTGGSGGSGGGVSGPNQSLALADSLLGAQQYATAQQLRNQALQSAVQGYNQRAPLRAQGIAMTTQAARPDLDSLFESSNPFSKSVGDGSPVAYDAAPYQAAGSGIQTAPQTTDFTAFPEAQQAISSALGTASSSLPANSPLQIKPMPGLPGHYTIGINPPPGFGIPKAAPTAPTAPVNPVGTVPGIPNLTPPPSPGRALA